MGKFGSGSERPWKSSKKNGEEEYDSDGWWSSGDWGSGGKGCSGSSGGQGGKGYGWGAGSSGSSWGGQGGNPGKGSSSSWSSGNSWRKAPPRKTWKGEDEWEEWKGEDEEYEEYEPYNESNTGPQAQSADYQPVDEEKKEVIDKIPRPVGQGESGEGNFWGGRMDVGETLPCDVCGFAFHVPHALVQCRRSDGVVPNINGAGAKIAQTKEAIGEIEEVTRQNESVPHDLGRRG